MSPDDILGAEQNTFQENCVSVAASLSPDGGGGGRQMGNNRTSAFVAWIRYKGQGGALCHALGPRRCRRCSGHWHPRPPQSNNAPSTARSPSKPLERGVQEPSDTYRTRPLCPAALSQCAPSEPLVNPHKTPGLLHTKLPDYSSDGDKHLLRHWIPRRNEIALERLVPLLASDGDMGRAVRGDAPDDAGSNDTLSAAH